MQKTIEEPRSVVVDKTVYECDQCGEQIPEEEADRVWMSLLINTTDLDVTSTKVKFSGRDRESEYEMLCDSCSGGNARSDAKELYERSKNRRESIASMVARGITVGIPLSWTVFTLFLCGFLVSIWEEVAGAYPSIVQSPEVAFYAGMGGVVSAFIGLAIGGILVGLARFVLSYFDIEPEYLSQ